MRRSSGCRPRRVKTHGSEEHCVKPYARSQGKSVRCHRLPACAMLVPCRKWVSLRGKCGDGRPRLGYCTPGAHGSTLLRRAATPPSSKLRRSPNVAYACRCPQRWTRGRGGKLAA
eukprot:5227021-Pleurochrysis_carterae.AAC.3